MFYLTFYKFCGILKIRRNTEKGVADMKKFLLKYGGFLAAFAMCFTTLTANSTCAWVTYQEELPKEAEKLRKF